MNQSLHCCGWSLGAIPGTHPLPPLLFILNLITLSCHLGKSWLLPSWCHLNKSSFLMDLNPWQSDPFQVRVAAHVHSQYTVAKGVPEASKQII